MLEYPALIGLTAVVEFATMIIKTSKIIARKFKTHRETQYCFVVTVGPRVRLDPCSGVQPIIYISIKFVHVKISSICVYTIQVRTKKRVGLTSNTVVYVLSVPNSRPS